MDDGYEAAIEAELAGGNNEESTPLEGGSSEVAEVAESSTAQAPAEPDNLRALLEAKKAAHPELAETIEAIHREFQSGLTPKLQEAAELRRKLEGLDDGAIEWVRNFRATAAQSPAAAQQMLREALEEIESYGQPPAPANPFGDLEWASEGERVLGEKLATLETYMVQQQSALLQATADKHFSELSVQWGEIPFEQRRAVELSRNQAGLSPEMIPVLWKGMFGIEAAQKRAVEQTVSGQKSGLGPPPSGLVSRPVAIAADPSAMSFDEYLKRANIPDF